MARYTRDSVERVKEAVDMVELVGGRTELRRVGGRYVGLCPFHDERTPSFSVTAEQGLYHCFGCGASGDALRFVEETEGLEFPDAVELLAERYGVELRSEEEDPRAEERRRRRARLLALVDRAATFYARYLWESAEGADARAYLAGRGLGEPVLRRFRVGLAPTGWDRVVAAARRDGFGPEEIVAAGVGQQGARGLIDRFRGRILFPLADPRGRVLGFGARALREGDTPKYLNSSENELYRKRSALFGVDRARATAARAGRVVVVEGYTDVLALHEAGVEEAVAIMGTSLTGEQLVELSRAASRVFLALDADRAGQEAMLRAARAAEERAVELRVVALPPGADPADLIAQAGPDAFRTRLEEAVSVPEWEARRVLERAELATPAGRDRALAALRPIIAATSERSATRDELVRLAADRLDVPDHYLLDGPASRSRPARIGDRAPSASPAPVAPAVRRRPLTSLEREERSFLALCLRDRALGRAYLERLGPDHLSSPDLRRVRDHLVAHPDDPLAHVPPDDPDLRAQVSAVVLAAEHERTGEALLHESFLRLELRGVERALRLAQREGARERQVELLSRREGLREEADQVTGSTA